MRRRLGDIVGRLAGAIEPSYNVRFASADCSLTLDEIGLGTAAASSRFGGIIAAEIANDLPPKDEYTPDVWKKLAGTQFLEGLLKKRVAAAAAERYRQLCSAPSVYREYGEAYARRGGGAEAEVKAMLDRESRTAGLLRSLADNRRFGALEAMFYGEVDNRLALWDILARVDDPFATIDPAHDLDRVGLSPLGIAHLFREYFFELDTFLGTPVGHVWLAPGATVELIEIQTRRVLTEQSYEQAVESTRKSEESVTQQDDLSDAIKDNNRSDVKLGVNVSANQSWGWGARTNRRASEWTTHRSTLASRPTRRCASSRPS